MKNDYPTHGWCRCSVLPLAESTATLDEVVVVGYGTQKRSRVVSAVDQVGEAAFDRYRTVTVTQSNQ